MDAASRERAEALIKTAWDRGDMKGAVGCALSAYEPEIAGYLLALLRDEQRAKEVYSDFSEDVVRGMPGFRFQASVRTWLYTLAHHAFVRYVRREQRMRTSEIPDVEEIDVPAVERSPTPPYRRTSVREGFERLRSELKPEEQMLLILHVNRKMKWRDIARILADPGAELDDVELDTRAAKLRKQYERLKARLRRLARTGPSEGENEHG